MEPAIKRSKLVISFIRRNPSVLIGATCLMIISKLSFSLYIIGLMVNLMFIKYIQLRLRFEYVSTEVLKNIIKDKFLDVLIISLKVMLVMMPVLMIIGAEIRSIVNRYLAEGSINYLSIGLFIPTFVLMTFMMNRLSIHKEMAVLSSTRGNTSIEVAFNITKKISEELLPVTLLEVLQIITGMVLLSIEYKNFITYEKIVVFQGLSIIIKIFLTAFLSCYKVSCFMALDESGYVNERKVRKM